MYKRPRIYLIRRCLCFMHISDAVLTFYAILGSIVAVIIFSLYILWDETDLKQWGNVYNSVSTINMFFDTLFVYLTLKCNEKTYKILCFKCNYICLKCFGSKKDVTIESIELQDNSTNFQYVSLQ